MDESRLALVTAGTGGLGKAIAMELARRGWSIFLQYSTSPAEAAAAVQAVEASAKEAGREIQVVARAANTATAASREELVEQALENFGRLDMLVNCPSTTSPQPQDLLELSEESYQAAMQAGPAAVLFLSQLVANEMVRLVESGDIESPRIITINSISSYTTSADLGPTCIASAATSMVTRLLADRLGEHGINVYEICTGLIATTDQAAHAQYDELISRGLTPLRRWGRPGDVARTVAAIAEDLLTFSTGEVINVDGGFHLRRM